MPLDPIDIPAESRREKQCDAPDDRLVEEIRAWVKETGSPHTFRLHTHTRPPRGSLPIYIEEFTLPKQFRSLARRAPCPCCTDHFPKYWKNGKIAYFPAERLLRLMGPECFATLDAGGHRDALDRMRTERRRRNDIRYLIEHAHLLPTLGELLGEWLTTIEQIDDARFAVRQRLELLKLSIWPHVRDGSLRVTRARTVTYRKPDGTEGERTVHDLHVYGSIRGHAFFSPDAKRISSRLSVTHERLLRRVIHTRRDIEQMNDQQRRNTAQLINHAVTRMRDAYAEVTDIRRALSPESMATLNGWSRDPGADFPIHFETDREALYIGRSSGNLLRIKLGLALWATLRPMPQIAEIDLAAE